MSTMKLTHLGKYFSILRSANSVDPVNKSRAIRSRLAEITGTFYYGKAEPFTIHSVHDC